jgi:phospholipid N-methyltransferase
MWTPAREDLLLELCGEIGDEDTSLAQRAEDRADRFDDYSAKRAGDAERARAGVAAIADNIPLGQPILIGHHSEKHARKDAERIENGMRKAVKLWRTSQYWQDRAAGAIAHAKYKERPDVRARRIKGIEADKRKQERYRNDTARFIRMWESLHDDSKWKGDEVDHMARAKWIANQDHIYRKFSVAEFPRKPGASTYEGDQSIWSALDSEIITPEQAQEIALKSHRAYIPHCERWIEHYENRLTYERAMLAESGGTVADQNKPEKGGAVKCWVSARGGWSYVCKVNKTSVSVQDNWGNGGRNFSRTVPFDKLAAIMSIAEVQRARDENRLIETEDKTGFFLVDSAPAEKPQPKQEDRRGEDFDKMAETLRAGVKVVSVPQLFATPAKLAQRMAIFADIQTGCRVLEPSAGTGALVDAVLRVAAAYSHVTLRAVEIDRRLADNLAHYQCAVDCCDFLTLNGDLGKFDRIVMNPPFKDAVDIKHIEHALHMLKPGGRLVALCANGPRQREKLKPLASRWEDLPADTFKEQGTSVNAAMLIIDAPAEDGIADETELQMNLF